jgi:hypothetical protein
MGLQDIRNGIDNEFRRVQIQNHANYSNWYASLPAYARQIIDLLLYEDLTPEVIEFAQNAPDEEYDVYQFISIIAGGNPNPANMPSLTNFTLIDIHLEVREFGENAA